MAARGDTLALAIERPAIGGRMIARHDGAVVLVSGTIPGERVLARVERVQRRTIFATAVEIVEASPDRVPADAALTCGGNVFAHVSAARQATLKAEMVVDAFRRLGRLDVTGVAVATGPSDGYRTRARVHVRRGHWGFFAESSHVPCGIAGTRQLSDESAGLLDRLCEDVAATAPESAAEVEWAESTAGDRRVAHVQFTGPGPHGGLSARPGLEAVSWADATSRDVRSLWGDPTVTDEVRAARGARAAVRHHVRSFFQGNRYLLQTLVDDVAGRLDDHRVADLYAGVGLFSLRLAADGRRVEAVEGDRQAAADLSANARADAAIAVHRRSVESFVASGALARVDAVVVDPPRTGLGLEVTQALCASRVARMVYVSCDPATLARDVRLLVDAGFAMRDVRAIDLFPRTAHIETVLTLER